jgi:hypothetical protein
MARHHARIDDPRVTEVKPMCFRPLDRGLRNNRAAASRVS